MRVHIVPWQPHVFTRDLYVMAPPREPPAGDPGAALAALVANTREITPDPSLRAAAIVYVSSPSLDPDAIRALKSRRHEATPISPEERAARQDRARARATGQLYAHKRV